MTKTVGFGFPAAAPMLIKKLHQSTDQYKLQYKKMLHHCWLDSIGPD